MNTSYLIYFLSYVLFHLTNPFNEMIRFTSLGSEANLSTGALDFIFIIFSDFLFNTIFGQSQNVGVNYVTSVSASVEAHREVRCDLHCVDI